MGISFKSLKGDFEITNRKQIIISRLKLFKPYLLWSRKYIKLHFLISHARNFRMKRDKVKDNYLLKTFLSFNY